MRKGFALLLFAMLAALCSALGFVPGNGLQVVDDPGREYAFAYHNGMDDYHFYGANVWAVRFDFSAVYPSLPGAEFSVSKALLYFPQLGDSVRAELYSDAYGVPGVSLAWAKVPVTSNFLEIPFPTSVQNDSLWLVVSYTTNFANRFVSASSGGGTHSYYWNTNAQTPYFQSLATAGYNAELLFGLGGDFVLPSVDLELVDLDLSGLIRPRETVGVTFSVYNHSDQPINSATLELNVYSPDPGFAFYDEIGIATAIPPRSLFVFNETSPGFAEHQFELPGTPLQIKLRGAVTSSFQDTDPQSNNVRIIHRFSFAHEYPVYLGENFLRYSNVTQITALQDQMNLDELHLLNYFPVLSDTMGNIAAQVRFNWYGFNSLPRTVLNGDLRINGLNPDYASQLSQNYAQAIEQRTFISQAECRINYLEQSDLLSASLTLTNAETLLYATAPEYMLISQAALCVGLFKRVQLNGADRWVIARWITHGTALDGTLGAGETYTASFNIPLNSLTLADLSQNYRLYYWLQMQGGGQILYSAWTDFTGIVSNSEDLNSSPSLIVSGNPLTPGSEMLLRLSNGEPVERLQVFNIRGQKILDFPAPTREIRLTADLFPASGIYFLRLPSSRKHHQSCIQTKIYIIK